MPISFFEGIRPDEREDLSRKNMQRRFYALAVAVRDHESAKRRDGVETGVEDEELYRRLREINGETPTAEHAVA